MSKTSRFHRPNPTREKLTQCPAEGYFGLCLGNGLNFNQTMFRRKPKAVRGKAAVKRAKRLRQTSRHVS